MSSNIACVNCGTVMEVGKTCGECGFTCPEVGLSFKKWHMIKEKWYRSRKRGSFYGNDYSDVSRSIYADDQEAIPPEYQELGGEGG